MAVLSSLSSPSLALDGRVDVRGYQQGGRAGELTYTTENVWENYSLDQRVQLARSTLFQVRYAFRRENLWSRNTVSSSESRRESHVPFAALTYRGRNLRAGLTGNGLRKDTFAPGTDTRRDESVTSSAWIRYDVGKAELSARYLETRTDRTQALERRKTTNRVLGFIARYDVSNHDRLRYSLNNTQSDQVTLGNDTRYISNVLEYSGNHRFAEDRGRFNISTSAGRFDQKNTLSVPGSRAYLTPIYGGVLLDDTPEEQDPLEPDPVPEVLLYDNDLETPTMINIGNSATAVREFGGDYRNIIIDLGTQTTIDSVALHISAQIDFPALIQWQVYVTNDPEGRDWGVALTPDVVTVSYQEWELGRQGWQVQFTTPLTQRRVKMVNTKLGITEPDIFVTEMEVFSAPDEREDEVTSTLSRYRLYGEVRYDVLPNLEINYTADAYEYRRDGGRRDLSGAIHQAGSIWRPASWEVSGYYQISTLSSASRSDTDARSQFLSVARRFDANVDSRISWKRVDDRSPALGYTTNNINLDVNWHVAPGLWLNQKVGRGVRTDNQSTGKAESWVLSSSIRSNPTRTMSVDLRHVDRWVDRIAGNGFTAFSNTELITRWAILPLLAFDSQIVYRMRDESDWSARNQISWSPIPGGNLGMSFNVADYRDTRVDIEQRSVGTHFNWRVRSNTRVEFGAEYVDITQRGEKNRPHNLYARGSMNF